MGTENTIELKEALKRWRKLEEKIVQMYKNEERSIRSLMKSGTLHMMVLYAKGMRLEDDFPNYEKKDGEYILNIKLEDWKHKCSIDGMNRHLNDSLKNVIKYNPEFCL
jgi:hypothetical protein